MTAHANGYLIIVPSWYNQLQLVRYSVCIDSSLYYILCEKPSLSLPYGWTRMLAIALQLARKRFLFRIFLWRITLAYQTSLCCRSRSEEAQINYVYRCSLWSNSSPTTISDVCSVYWFRNIIIVCILLNDFLFFQNNRCFYTAEYRLLI